MTTTSTFQGMDRDARTSSKVLNPPGGGSSNIFGTCEDASPQRRPVRNNPDNVNRGNNDIMNQGGRQMPVVQDKGKAPRSAFNPITGEAYDSPKPQVSNEKVTEATAVVDPEPGANAESESQSDGATNTQPKEDRSVPAVPTDSDVKEHTSTRVSQPPGGRCTKLW